MNIYLVERTDKVGYDGYDSFVVVSESEEKAKSYKPINIPMEMLDKHNFSNNDWDNDWTNNPNSLVVTLIGEANTSLKEGTGILSSFNPG